MTDIFNTIRSGGVTRFHSGPDFARVGQTNAAHQWGVAVLIRLLHPSPGADLLTAALTHDVGEFWVGDLPHPFKEASPEIARAHKVVEFKFRDDALGFTIPLTDEDFAWLNLCDRLEAYLFAAHHKPAVLERPDWKRSKASILEAANPLGCWTVVENLLREAEDNP